MTQTSFFSSKTAAGRQRRQRLLDFRQIFEQKTVEKFEFQGQIDRPDFKEKAPKNVITIGNSRTGRALLLSRLFVFRQFYNKRTRQFSKTC